MVALGMMMSMALQAGPQGGVWPVISRRSGVASANAVEVAEHVCAALREGGVHLSAPAEDLSSCNGKKPCLVEAGRKKGAAAMVLIEVGNVLGDGFARAEAISIEEDGRKLGVAEFEGAFTALGKGLGAAAARSLTAPLKAVLGAPAAEASPLPPPPPPPPLVIAPPPSTPKPADVPAAVSTPKPAGLPAAPSASVAASAPTERRHGPLRGVGLGMAGVGAVALAGAGVIGLTALDASNAVRAACPAGRPCTTPAAYDAYARAANAHNTAVLVASIGAGVAAAGALLFFLDPGGVPAVSLVPVREGAVAAVSGRF